MATKIEAMTEYGPRIVPGQSAGMEKMVEFMMRNSGQSKGESRQVILNIVEGVINYLSEGRSVHIDDLGTFSAEVGLDGSMHVNFRPDPDLIEQIRIRFSGLIANKENIGKTLVELVALWNAEPAHADDQIPTP